MQKRISFLQFCKYIMHCGMRGKSSRLVMATNQNSGIGSLFSAESNFRVKIPDFRQAHHYKISKNHFSGSQHQKVLFTSSSLRPAGCEQFYENSALVYLPITRTKRDRRAKQNQGISTRAVSTRDGRQDPLISNACV